MSPPPATPLLPPIPDLESPDTRAGPKLFFLLVLLLPMAAGFLAVLNANLFNPSLGAEGEGEGTRF